MIYEGGAGRLDPLPEPTVPRTEVIDELYAAVVEGRPPLHDGIWAMATFEVCLAFLRSARESGEVALASSGGPALVSRDLKQKILRYWREAVPTTVSHIS